MSFLFLGETKESEIRLLDYILDGCLDTLKAFIVILIINILVTFIEGKIANKIKNTSKFSPIIGASVGLIPQCGFSIVSADFYRKKYITIGTLFAVFIATSDEAIPILLSNTEKFYMIFPLIGIKFVTAVIFGYLIDLVFKTKLTNEKVVEEEIHVGCCNHEIEEENESKIKKHLVHPLLHSLKIGIYVLFINILFAIILFYIGEDKISDFLNQNIYIAPIFATLVGLIPNCAASVIITELYISSSLSFGATIAGLICNAGLGLIYLIKDKSMIKKTLLIIAGLIAIGLFVGYTTLFIEILITK